MDTHELFLASRRGDLAMVQDLVEQREVELNVRDKWDSTPLFYACLCGHEDVVKYLLENGAKCAANTFDGERCLYGALNNEIRNLLKSYKAVTSSTIRRDLYYEFLRRMQETGHYSDIAFIVHGENFAAHQCILSARSEYFAEMILNKWKDRSTIALTHKLLIPWAFKAILQYLYTARLEAHIDQLAEIVRLARQCHLENLIKDLEDKMQSIASFESAKPGVNVSVICVEPNPSSRDLHNDLALLAYQALPVQLCNEAGIELPFPPEEVQNFADVIFCVDGHEFRCHKVFFCGRSDYFRALLHDHFGENSTMLTDDVELPVITLHEISPAIFAEITMYIYQDSCELTEHNVYELLYAGEMYLLPGLKRQCAYLMGHLMADDNIINTLRLARLFNLSRLEDQCAEYIADNIEQVVKLEEFATLVKEDARSVQERQEADTIPIIDEVRFHITNFVQTFSDMDEADEKLSLIDNFLEELELEG